MQQKILLLSDCIPPDKLEAALKASDLENSNDIQFQLENEPDGIRAIDACVLAAIITSSATVISTLITVIVTLTQKEVEQNSIPQSTVVSVKGKNGVSVSFPMGADDAKIKELIALANQLDIDTIAID